MSLTEVLSHCLRQNYHADNMNAAVHTAAVRYSPITFRLAEALRERLDHVETDDTIDLRDVALVDDVMAHRGAYEEDKGR